MTEYELRGPGFAYTDEHGGYVLIGRNGSFEAWVRVPKEIPEGGLQPYVDQVNALLGSRSREAPPDTSKAAFTRRRWWWPW